MIAYDLPAASPAPTYPVNDLYPTLQGEGAYTGQAMTLLRLHGCPVGCPWCDTKETWALDETQRQPTLGQALGANEKWCSMTAEEIADVLHSAAVPLDPMLVFPPAAKWVLLTGGEPALYDLAPLTDALHGKGFKIALETSGTALGHVNAALDWITVSPKWAMPGGQSVRPQALRVAHEIKQVVGRQKDLDDLELILGRWPLRDGVIISLQPVSQSEKATDLCIQTCLQRGWRLSLQTHKFIQQR